MTMTTLDWGIVVMLLTVLAVGALRTRRYTKSVSAFLAAERCGGRYIISVADQMAAVGVITLVWYFEQNYKVGFTPYWWGLMEGPTMIIMALSGWVIYRYRQTRAMTLAQFFEIRYSRRFRVFAGLVAFVAGVINFGVFPSVGARFFMSLCGLPETLAVGGAAVPTFPVIMIFLIGTSLAFVFAGGQIAVMVTDFLQGIFCNAVFILVCVVLLMTFDWDQIGTVLLDAPPDESKVHPFELGQESHFDVWYYVISVVIIFYGALGWQGTQGYNAAAINAHEAKMAGILKGWRPRVLMIIVIVLPICVRTMMHHPAYAAEAAQVHAGLAVIDDLGLSETQTSALQNQVRTPLALAAILPAGILGLACAAMLGAFISTNDTYLHSWGSILIQDVILPFRRTPFTPRQHLRLLRFSILGVAIVVFFFSLLFRHTQYLAMFLALSGAVFVGGAGSAIIGGLYWKRGTTAAAWSAMLTGMGLSVAGIFTKQIDPAVLAAWRDAVAASDVAWIRGGGGWLLALPDLTGQVMTFWAIAASVTAYVSVSLLGPRAVFDMDRMLHRGKHALAGETATSIRDATTWAERLGFSRDFTGWDRIVAYVTLAWPLVWTVIFVLGTIYNLVVDVSAETWLAFWHFWTWLVLVTAAIVTVWFAIGGTHDLLALFRRLRAKEAAGGGAEDGRVVDHRNVGE